MWQDLTLQTMRKNRMKHFIYMLLLVFVCITLSSCQTTFKQKYYVNSKTPVNLYESPSTDSKVVATHNEDSRILLVDKYDDKWSKVLFANRDTGYISSSVLEIRWEEVRSRKERHWDDLVIADQKIALAICDAFAKLHITFVEGLIALILAVSAMPLGLIENKILRHVLPFLLGLAVNYLLIFAEGNDGWMETGCPGIISKPLIWMGLLFMVMFIVLFLDGVFSLGYMPKGRWLHFVLSSNDYSEDKDELKISKMSRHIMGNLIILMAAMFCGFFIEDWTDSCFWIGVAFNGGLFIWYFIVGIKQKKVYRVLFALLMLVVWIVPLLICAAILYKATFVFLCYALLIDGAALAGGHAVSDFLNPKKVVEVGYDNNGHEIRVEHDEGSYEGYDQYGNKWEKHGISGSEWGQKDE